ncbi:RNase H family protein [uncultured Acetatifactor sp.]|uniref:RNase H family protein n=1 Tax=uncultured Acetatifactor sp. TaxID=1671927 RepID=UPI0026306CCF|nr:RNase H family protein [uncultured Acetatifactor sp.]
MKAVSIYIDTSIKGPRRRDGACQYILSYHAANGKVADMGGRILREGATENQLALLGLEGALKHLREPCALCLYLECRHVASAIKGKWYEDWRYGGWMTAKGRPVSHAETWQSVAALLAAHEMEVRLEQEHPYREWLKLELWRRRKEEGF